MRFIWCCGNEAGWMFLWRKREGRQAGKTMARLPSPETLTENFASTLLHGCLECHPCTFYLLW